MTMAQKIDYELPYEGTEISDRLRNWIDWNRRRERNMLGYPASPIARMVIPNQEARRQPRNDPDSQDALKVESAVIRLPEKHRVVVTVHYWYESLPRDSKLREIAKRGYALQKTRYYEVLRDSEVMIKNLLTRADKRHENSRQFI